MHGLNRSLHDVVSYCSAIFPDSRLLYCSKGSFTYYVISRGGGGFQMLTVDYGGGGGLVVDYVIKIFYQFS